MTVVAVNPVVSPCISVCELNEQDICLGCGRSLQDIADWSAADELRRAEIVEVASKRMQAMPSETKEFGVLHES